MATHPIEVWYSPAAQCYRVEDGELFTYDVPDQVIDHLRRRGATALISPPPHTGKTAQLVSALAAAGIATVYGAH